MGVSVDVKKVTADHYTVQRGVATLFGGCPIVEGDGTRGGSEEIWADLNYKINEDGTLAAWTIFQAEASALPIQIGELLLVILRLNGTDYEVVGVSEMDRSINAAGAIEFPCEIEVQRNDIVGIWFSNGTAGLVSTQTDVDQPSASNLLLNFTGVSTVPAAGDNLGAATTVTGGYLLSLTVRGEIDDSTIEDVTNGWADDGGDDDAYNYGQFIVGTSGLAYFAEANVNNLANLFDNTDTSYADVGIGVSTLNNIYYFLGIGNDADLVPVERFILNGQAIPTDGVIRVYGSADVAQVTPMDLAKAQAVTDWVEILELTSAVDVEAVSDCMYHVAKKYKWLRLEIVGGSAAATYVGAFEVEIHNVEVTNGEFPPHADAALKNKFYFDPDSGAEMEAVSAMLTQTVKSTDAMAYCENADAEFFAQLRINGYVYLRRNVPRGSNNMMKRVTVIAADFATLKVTFSAQPGEDFQIGDFIDPEVWFLRVYAYDANDRLFGTSNWLGYHNTLPDWIRQHDTFVSAGN